MKILIFYTPRSKSTFLAKTLASKFDINLFNDELTISRIKNQGFVEYPELIEKINTLSDACIKVCANDFIDLQNCCISDYYKQIKFELFDHVIFISRKNFFDSLLSYAYMDPTDQSSWHRIAGQTKIIRRYTIPDTKIFYLCRGYFVFNYLKLYIQQKSTNATFFDYDYNTVDSMISNDWNIDNTVCNIDLLPNDVPYKDLVENYNQIKTNADRIFYMFKNISLAQFNNKNSFAWKTQI